MVFETISPAATTEYWKLVVVCVCVYMRNGSHQCLSISSDCEATAQKPGLTVRADVTRIINILDFLGSKHVGIRRVRVLLSNC
jgi:hypothetical protein